MRFGVNYIPGRSWLYSWVDWSADRCAEDLAAIRGLGFDHVRVHLLWPLFQPNPAWVSPVMLERLHGLLDACSHVGLQAQVTVLNGWMSGFLFRPSWMSPQDSFFSHPATVRAEHDCLREIATSIASHPAALGIDIGNELSVLTDFEPAPVSPEVGDPWSAGLLDTAASAMPAGMHCNGVDHRPWLTELAPFSRTQLARTGSVSVVHSWPFFTGAFERYGTEDNRALHIGEFMVELANAYAPDPARQVWAQEIGLSEQWIPGARITGAADYFVRATASASRLWGITWWCSHDIDTRFAGFSPLEHDLGLLTTDNAVKPMGRAVSDAIAELREQVPAADRDLVIPFADDEAALPLMDRFLAARLDGARPRLQLERAG